MKRVSKGVILRGNPDCIQQQKPWIKALELVCFYGFFISFIIGALLMFQVFAGNADLFQLGCYILLSSFILFIASLLWEDKIRCRYCKHFFTLKRISENHFVDSSKRTISKTVHNDNSGIAFDFHGNSAFYSGISSHKEYGTEETKRYTYNVQCTCCGAVTKVETSKTFKNI